VRSVAAKRSKHLEGAAFDISMANHDPETFEAAAREVGFLGFGFYPRSGFMHMSILARRGVGDAVPERRVTAFAENRRWPSIWPRAAP
jgi:zinc D-Ala-D-Ala carboxypeptidase